MDTEAYYSRWATAYDAVATAPGIGRWRRAAAEAVATPGDTVVEMGCGTGANAPYLREQVGPNGRVVGVDVTEALLRRERTRPLDGVLRGDATRPPIRDVDAILGTFVCGMFEDPAAAVERWCEIVGPGGRVAIMNATATESAVGRPLNPLFRAFVEIGSPGAGAWDVVSAIVRNGGSPDRLDDRVSAARDALVARTERRRFETFGLGFVGLLSGTVSA